ncbi:unnamed protein product [Urochloa humidicola]
MAIDLNEAPPEGDEDGLLEHELLAIDLNEAPPEGDEDVLLEHELLAIDLNEPLVDERDGVLPVIDLNEPLVDEQDGVLPVQQLHEYDEEGLHPGIFLNEMLLVFFLPLLGFTSMPRLLH